MDAKTLEFFALAMLSLLSIVAGYTARQRGWLKEEFSRSIHWFTIVVLWSTGGLFALWNLVPDPANVWILVIEPLLVVIPAFLMIPLAKAMKLKRNQVGVVAIAAGLRNSGFALGAFLAYAILPAGELLRQQGAAAPDAIEQLSIEALAYGMLIVMTMSMAVVLFLFPIAQHFGDHREGDAPLPTLIYRSFVDWKAMLFYAAIAGIALAYLRVPFPTVVHDWHLLKALIFVGSATAYFGVGMRLHINQLRRHLRSHLLLAAVKFIGTPLTLLLLLVLIRMTGLAEPTPLLIQTMILMALMPMAIQGVMVANLFHLDVRMAGSVWIVNTLIFLLVILPIVLVVTSRL